MKVFTLKSVATFLAGILAATIPTARAQSPAQSVGTLSGLGPDTIVVRSTAQENLSATSPVRPQCMSTKPVLPLFQSIRSRPAYL